MRSRARTFAVLSLTATALLAAGCDGGGDATPQGRKPPTAAQAPSHSPVPGNPLAHATPLPDCAALGAKLPSGVFTPQPGAATPQPKQAKDDLRESVTCSWSGTLTGSGTAMRVEILVERPLTDPVDGVPVEQYLKTRPEQVVKERCPEFPYAPVAELPGGMTCYLRTSATEAQGLVSGADPDATVLVTTTVSDPGRSPADLRTAAQSSARTVAGAVVVH